MAGIVHHVESNGSRDDTQQRAEANTGKYIQGKKEQSCITKHGQWNQDKCLSIQFPVARFLDLIFMEILIHRRFQRVKKDLVLIVKSYFVHR